MTQLFVVVLAACSLALGGCGLERASASGTASATPTASLSAAWTPEQIAKREAAVAIPPPVQPENMHEYTQAGAIETAKYFVQLYPYANATGNLEQMREISREDCEFCGDTISDVEEVHNEGGWKDYWLHNVTQAKYASPRQDGYPDCPRVYLGFNQEAGYSYRNPNDGPKFHESQLATRVLFVMKYEDGRWMIREVIPL